MTPAELRDALQARGVVLTATGDHLSVDAPAGALTAELRTALREHKPALLALLTEAPPVPSPEEPEAEVLDCLALRAELDRLGVRLWLDDSGQAHFESPPGAPLPSHLREAFRHHRREVGAWLRLVRAEAEERAAQALGPVVLPPGEDVEPLPIPTSRAEAQALADSLACLLEDMPSVPDSRWRTVERVIAAADDALREAMARLGLTLEDLGWRLSTWGCRWERVEPAADPFHEEPEEEDEGTMDEALFELEG